MGRFDSLTQLENRPLSPTRPPMYVSRKPENLKTGIQEITKSRKPENLISGKPELMNTRKPEIMKTTNQDNERAEKYSTSLPPSLVKRLKQYALEHDLKDYEVIAQALKDLFAKTPKT